MLGRSSILAHLNPPQQAAVTYGEGPLLILAGPGSGKTRALTHRAAYLIKEKQVPPENILLLTFTNKAADEMKIRLQKLLVPSVNSVNSVNSASLPFAGTFHSFCARVLRRYGQAIGIPPGFTIYDTSDQKEAIKQTLRKLNFSEKKLAPTAVLKTISQAKNEMITATEYPQYARGPWQRDVAEIYLAYEKMLRQYQALDFDDLLLKTVQLFRSHPEVLANYQNQFQYILIDEYQDTNQAQYLLTRQLVGKWRNLCAVGDASQAIYGFRGANYRNLLTLQQDFVDLKTINLEQNYRSTQTILSAANAMIKKNASHPVLNLWTQNGAGDPVALYEARSEIDEADFIVNTVATQTLRQPSFSPADFAILYRTNAQSRTLEEAFLHAGLPYRLVGGTRFYDRKEIKDCLAYLKYWTNPQDKVAFKRIEQIGKRRAEKFLKFKEKQAPSLSTLKLLDKILQTTAYLELFDSQSETDLAKLENIKELRSVATQHPDLTNFLENVALVEQENGVDQVNQADQVNQGVTLMTAHAAKGTEFPIVFVVGLEEGLFPHSRSLLEKDKIEEERRLFYVAMTRAKSRLFLSYARRRLYFGQRTSNPLSRFVNDIPTDLLEFINESLLE
ncbi:ATP-dependent DNA helicase PcrA [Candidatus Shapirobacteria bacterium CG10_big_fil_rev_8_21_14_0_10_48_15]|uniref:DNA 3'-5' helicase n=1 Tax=Candidatus Shapirobacteria bacterium CG10_big_fil_rev_8_21_14_0_10_48_15 TaxID=1974484 RepID=A0A2M8L6R1_9BACT|nr:MAG: ATP-dependent DNA helicase PcrA [Candidatus Shapirobacteria bacterium CG10_big_fil_rev_8_21_14_0_10_48_15]